MDARREAILAAAKRAPARRELPIPWWLGALAVTAGIFLVAGGVRPYDRPVALTIATATGAAVLAAAAVWLAFGRGRSMLGRPIGMILVVTAAVPLALMAWKVGASAAFEGMSAAWPQKRGFRCLGWSLAYGAAPLVALLWMRRGSAPTGRWLRGAALGVAAGACAWVPTDLWCPVAYVPHLLLGHLLPIVILAVVGAVAGGLILRVRAGNRS
jgi:hypothetical protein